MLITSTDNKKIKEINKLKLKKYRNSEEKFIIETPNLIKEANDVGLLLEVFLLEGYSLPFEISVPVNYVTKEVMNKIKNVNTSFVVGICKKAISKGYIGKKYLLLDGVSDPGNIGTILRSSVAFGVDTVILSTDSCDLYNDKVIRASEGAIFKLNILRENLIDTIDNLKSKSIPIYGTDVNSGIEVSSIEKDSFAIIMGSEGNGIKEEIKKMVDKNIYIKINNTESLNVAVSASIILYELSK